MLESLRLCVSHRFGMARKSTLIACKVLGGLLGFGSWDNSVEALEWITVQHNNKKKQGKTPRSVVSKLSL